MGEISEMMLDGTLCEGCGEYLGKLEGFPQLCASCAKERKADGSQIRDTGYGTFQDITPINQPPSKPPPEKVRCPQCRKRVKKVGLAQHERDTHGVKT